ncbi:SDR family NAD(P)-dependent oxidoreductase [Nonomuraea rubra]|uniref:SDR family NAD(P)-dependent oxidoreductase n=1 Tax=Nonomuraea rubra TaxID=46180 RepID=UPI0031F145CA
MTTTLITGANKGLGFETARRLVEAGHTVYLGSRDAGARREAADRARRAAGSSSTSPTTPPCGRRRARRRGGRRLDVLINTPASRDGTADGGVIGAAVGDGR